MSYTTAISQGSITSKNGDANYGALKFAEGKADMPSLLTPRRALGDMKNFVPNQTPFKTPSTYKNSFGPLHIPTKTEPVPFNISDGSVKPKQEQKNQQISASELQFLTIDPDAPAEKFNYEEKPTTYEDIVPDPERRLEVDQLFFDLISNREIVRQLFLDIVSQERFEQIERDTALPEEEFLKKMAELGFYEDVLFSTRNNFA